MSWLSWLVGKDNAVTKIVDKVAKGADELHFSGEEKAEKQAEFEKEITKRWVADAQAPITRLVRPVSYLFVTLVVFIFGALDSSLKGFTGCNNFKTIKGARHNVTTIPTRKDLAIDPII